MGQNKEETDRESHRTHPSKVEIFRWFLRNGMNKMDIDGVKNKDFNVALSKVGWTRGSPTGPQY